MSWYIQYVLRHADEIKESVYAYERGYNPNDSNFIASGSGIASDAYNDLLLIEKKITELHQKKKLSNFDLDLITLLRKGKTFTEVFDSIGGGYKVRSRVTLTSRFEDICNMLCHYMNYIYSDKNMVEKIKESYRLGEVDAELIKAYMSSRLKNKTIRRRLENV